MERELGTVSTVKENIFIYEELFYHFILNNINFLNTRYAKIHIPIIASVSEHQPTTWVSFFFDLHILVCTFPAGLWFCIKNINDERVFGKIFNKYFELEQLFLLLRLKLYFKVLLFAWLYSQDIFPPLFCVNVRKNSVNLHYIY